MNDGEMRITHIIHGLMNRTTAALQSFLRIPETETGRPNAQPSPP